MTGNRIALKDGRIALKTDRIGLKNFSKALRFPWKATRSIGKDNRTAGRAKVTVSGHDGFPINAGNFPFRQSAFSCLAGADAFLPMRSLGRMHPFKVECGGAPVKSSKLIRRLLRRRHLRLLLIVVSSSCRSLIAGCYADHESQKKDRGHRKPKYYG